MTTDPKKFVIVIPSYQNAEWCVKNILSALDQNYPHYRIIFTDDCSTDHTFNLVSAAVSQHQKKDIVQLIKNTERRGALYNLYDMIYSCLDEEIIITLDGDDWLAHQEVLSKLSEYYAGGDVWMTYGQYQNSDNGGIGISRQIPAHIINNNSYRQFHWCASHLRTFYTWLFKKIKKEDLMKDNRFYRATWDMAFMFPMLEMSGNHSQYISDILYIYNNNNPINDHKVNFKMQQDLDFEIRHKRRYPKIAYNQELVNKLPPLFYEPPPNYTSLPIAPIHLLRVGLILMSNDHNLLHNTIESANRFFIKGSSNITYYIFSDHPIAAKTGRRVIQMPLEPNFEKKDRFRYLVQHFNKLMQENYLYYLDANCVFKERVEMEIIGDLVGMIDSEKEMETETNNMSCLYIDRNEHRHYLNAFNGGRTEHYFHLVKYCSEMIKRDQEIGVQSKYHETSALNRYFYDYAPVIVLSSNYKGIKR